MSGSQVFISYAWGGESEVVANEIEAILSENRIGLIRDKTDLGFKGLIKEFMERIGQGDAVVIVISDKYLRSKNCMFELLEIKEHGDFIKRVLPVILPDANIYDSLGIIGYIAYWEKKIKELNKGAKRLTSIADIQSISDEINLYTDIRGAFDQLAGLLSNMNLLTLDLMRSKQFSPLLDVLSVANQEKGDTPQEDKKKPPSAKEGKVLYHIPSMMEVESWSRCTVRVAWEELLLLEDLDIPEEDRLIESIRLGEVMQVALIESPAEGNFSIQPLTNQEQIVSEDEFTQWLFDVKPFKQGRFKLLLRVTLIQIVQGKERTKDIVLERTVTTESTVPRALPRFDVVKERIGVRNETEVRSLLYSVRKTALPPASRGGDVTFSSTEKPRTAFIRYLPYIASSFLILMGALWVYRTVAPDQKVILDGGQVVTNEGIDHGAGDGEVAIPAPPPAPNPDQIFIASIEPTDGNENSDPVWVLMKASQLDSFIRDSVKISVVSPVDTMGRNFGKIRYSDYSQVKDTLAVRRNRDLSPRSRTFYRVK